MQCLQVDDVIPILLPEVYCSRSGSQGFACWHNDVTDWIIEPDCDHVVAVDVLDGGVLLMSLASF